MELIFPKKCSNKLKKIFKSAVNFQGVFPYIAYQWKKLAELPESHFDVITSSFAFHYIENFPTLLSTIHDKLSSNGTLIFSQEHPITTCHKEGERWEKNDKKQQVAYRLNHYREEGKRNRNWFKQPFQTYHRTTATIINNLIHARFQIEKMEEPMLADQPQWHNEFKDLSHRPPLLFIKARKVEK
ncbi:class I SAM-dependent methyltransferase [Haemophilus aegyptius]|uniref:class I SAM-dependent methyltransferase n=1 Tax=Haemophilus aegyptius TaxID=197575 RepID=UPI00211C2219|nr:class I SAM-dependent methyltransferase [Haemophilus aegyptius]